MKMPFLKNYLFSLVLLAISGAGLHALDVQINNNTNRNIHMRFDLTALYAYDEKDRDLTIQTDLSKSPIFSHIITIKPGQDLFVEQWANVSNVKYIAAFPTIGETAPRQLLMQDQPTRPRKFFEPKKAALTIRTFDPLKVGDGMLFTTREKEVLNSHDSSEILTINIKSVEASGKIKFEKITQPDLITAGKFRPYIILGVKPDADFETILRLKPYTKASAQDYKDELDDSRQTLKKYSEAEAGQVARVLKMGSPTFVYRRGMTTLTKDDVTQLQTIVLDAYDKALDKYYELKRKR